ncbi:MAG: hypothetical protein M1836_002030 [Candelina mexicana]|nr:MAG: hypothetical protein M1836_002030 [Candelina mexicana]
MPLLYPRPKSLFDPPTELDRLRASPLKYFMRIIYAILLWLRGSPYQNSPYRRPIRVVCISDTHNHTPNIPDGDLLIHAGDLTNAGTVEEIQAQIDWLSSLPHQEKVVIAGNHDSYFDPLSRKPQDKEIKSVYWGNIHYLEHSSVTLTFPSNNNRRLHVYGAPQIPQCGGWEFAFQHSRHEDTWSRTIPRETDILVTHTPPKYHLDLPVGLGDVWLLKEIWRVQPTLHVFGHVHAGHGREKVFWDEGQRAYERICARKDLGVVLEAFAVGAWLDALRVVAYGLQGVLWNRIWGGVEHSGLLVNAALVKHTGRIGNPAEVVEI